MAELVIDAVISVLFEKLADELFTKLAKSAQVYSTLNKWKDTLPLIQVVLVDAGQKRLKDEAVELWLNRLRHLAYEIEDVIDDFATEAAQQQQLSQESRATTSKVFRFVPTKFKAFKYRLKMSSKLDEITTKLNGLIKKKELLGLTANVQRKNGGTGSSSETTSLVDESKIIGRDGDKELLLEKLLGGESSSSQQVSVLSIVGLGGIGKTTLAQLLYNDKRVIDHFKPRSWVCVSDEFDVFKISQAIFKDVGGDDRKFETLNQLQVALKEKLSQKKFLLFLDDVWNENYDNWELLQQPFILGAPGSKVVVTTRKTEVVSVMGSHVEAYHLQLLPYEKALSLFSQNAAGEKNFDMSQMLILHGQDIVKKCGSLPLALKTVGKVFSKKSSEKEWVELLNSDIWNLDKDGILPALRLSYYDLPPHLQQMFIYCSLFPKDYKFVKDELVLLWMAEGFLNPSDKNMSMESFGRECFEKLVSRSFFQHSADDESGYTMHDLINDLAKSVAGEFFLRLDDKMVVDDGNADLEKIHHFSFVSDRYEPYKKFKAIQRATRLRTFLVTSFTRLDYWDRSYISNKVPTELFPQLQFLKVLSLNRYNITEVPKSIGALKHLRYLNFSRTEITCLPEQVGDLHNLQSLLLSSCLELSSLPNSIVKLIKLRHLDISDTPKLSKMPLGIGGLTGLRTLSKVIIGGPNDDFKISDLKGLKHLQGKLSIEGLHKVKNAVDAREANLQEKDIGDLHMEWSDDFDVLRNVTTEYGVLKELRPPKKLRSLVIPYYGGREFPSWVGDPAFDCLTVVRLNGCRSCSCLPTLGHLPSLQKLIVESMDGLERLGSEFLGASNSDDGVAFPSLEVLKFKDMKGWEEWSTRGGDNVGAFPRLRKITMANCPKLHVVAIDAIHSLRDLRVAGCSLAVLRSMVGVSSLIARLTVRGVEGLTQLHREVLEHLQAVEYLEIEECDELTYLWESEAAEILLSLQELTVKSCKNLASLAEKEVDLEISMESVRKVEIYGCPRLKSYSCPKSIETLYIYHCPSLTFLKMDGLQSTLKNFQITGCDNVEASWPLRNFLSSLESLHISSISNLRLLPEGRFVHLTELRISYCDNIEFIPDDGYGFLPFLSLRYLFISNCKNLKSFPHKHLQSLASLEEMVITECPSLDDSFPCGLWPPNLSLLSIGELKKPISEWGMQNFPPSLVTLCLLGKHSGVVSFAAAKAEENTISSSSSSSFLLPLSLNDLRIFDFEELESVSEGLQHLTSLQRLYISNCAKLRDLPETLFPSLLSLEVYDLSPKLKKKCKRGKGKYWPLISQIPRLGLREDSV